MFPTLARYVLFLESEGRSRATVKTYRSVISCWERTGQDPIVYLANLNHGSVTASTRAYHGVVLTGYFRWQVQCRLLAENPLLDVHFRRPPLAPVQPFSESETARLLAACASALESGVVLCLFSLGLRASELCAVREEDIHEGALVVRGKGGKKRLVATSPAIMRALWTISQERLSYLALYRITKTLGQKARVADCHPHRFRHTFGCRAYASGMDILCLQRLMGHSTLGMTGTERYVQAVEGERAVAAHRRWLENA
jgi:integrase